MNIARIAGIAVMAGLALFLISILAKVLIIGGIALFALRAVGRQIARRFYGQPYGPQGLGQGQWASTGIISIDNPAYRMPVYQLSYDRVISIN